MNQSNYQLFVGIDVSKKTLDYAVVDVAKNLLGQGKIDNNPKGLKKLKSQLKPYLKAKNLTYSQVLFCCENTGCYSEPLENWVTKFGYNLWVAHAFKIKKATSEMRGKSDAIDAQRIAMYAARYMDECRLYRAPRPVIKELQALVSIREDCTKMKGQIERKMKETKVVGNEVRNKIMSSLYKNPLQELKKAIKETEREIKKLIKSDEKLEETMSLATSIEGIGAITAAKLLIASNELKDIDTARKMACYAGVAPFPHASGTSVKGKTQVSPLASKPLKAVLHLAAMSASQSKGKLGEYYRRKVAEGKNKMSVLNAVRNKLIHLFYACIKNNQKYEKNYTRKLA